MAEVSFQAHAQIKSIIGKDLITDDNIAVLELVKNAFDANSKAVWIVFENLSSNDDTLVKQKPTRRTSKILLKDTGRGMSFIDLKDKWLNIAYSEKKAKPKDFGRLMAGNKGVGRFSCDRLGQYLDIYTRKRDENTILHLFIDWSLFEVEDKVIFNVQDVKLYTEDIPIQDFKRITGHDLFDKGTLLEISKLRAPWSHDKIISLKRQLEKLINPHQAFNKNSFNINLAAPEFIILDSQKKDDYSRINGLVANRVFENLDFKTSSIQSEIDPTGETITTTLFHKGNIVYTLIEKNTYASLKKTKVTVYYLNPYSKIYFSKQTGMRVVQFGSISLFINGFRIPPYGDPGNDWLALETRKGQGYSRYLGTRETVGRIEIDDEEGVFKIISSRSGLVENEAFKQLTESRSPFGYFYKTFKRLERFVVDGIKFDSTTEDERILEKEILNAGDSWREENEVYSEDSLTKNKRIIDVIDKIIEVRARDVVSLEINEEFVKEIVRAQVESSARELDKLAEEINQKDLGVREISSLIKKLETKAAELGRFSYSVTSRTNLAAVANDPVEALQQLFQDKVASLTSEKVSLEKRLATQEANAREEAEKAAEIKKRLEKELEAERKESLFHKRLAGTDIQEVVSLQHHIDRAANKINISIAHLIGAINSGSGKDILFRDIDRISLESRKISSIVQFVTNANFDLNSTIITENLNSFIEEYILNVHQEYDHLKSNGHLLPVSLKTDSVQFVTSFRPLEIIMVIDNLFSNSRRNKAQNVEISLCVNVENKFEFCFADDGIGIPDENISRIFNLGFTTTRGSGIGLHHVKEIVSKLNGSIIVDNKIAKGVLFKIKIPINHEA